MSFIRYGWCSQRDKERLGLNIRYIMQGFVRWIKLKPGSRVTNMLLTVKLIRNYTSVVVSRHKCHFTQSIVYGKCYIPTRLHTILTRGEFLPVGSCMCYILTLKINRVNLLV